MKRRASALALGALLAAIVAAPAGAVPPPFTVIAGGLHSPRGLTFGPGDRLYVAQAGDGSGSQAEGMSHTGAITEIVDPASASPTTRDVITGLSSYGALGDAVGVDGISALGNGGIAAIMGESRDRTGDPSAGMLYKVSTDGDARLVANVGSVDWTWTGEHPELDPGNPGETSPQYPDANPYGVLALPGRTYVADAGANTLDEVLPNGRVRILAYFPNIDFDVPFPPGVWHTDATPTCVAQGPDGFLYVGTLALVPSFFGAAQAKVYRVDPSKLGVGGVTMVDASSEWATGLWPLNGCTFGPDGTFYASELFTGIDGQGNPTGGDVVRIAWDDASRTPIGLTGGHLPLPGGVAVGRDGTVYAAMLSAFVPTGFVVRLTGR